MLGEGAWCEDIVLQTEESLAEGEETFEGRAYGLKFLANGCIILVLTGISPLGRHLVEQQELAEEFDYRRAVQDFEDILLPLNDFRRRKTKPPLQDMVSRNGLTARYGVVPLG